MTELPIPAPIASYLRRQVAHFFETRGQQAVDDACAALPTTLPEATVLRLASGGPFGWLLDARLDRDGSGRYVLEVLEDSRMSGPDHYRVGEDGTRDALMNERTMMFLPRDATAAQRTETERKYFAHNRAVGMLLHERGFR